MKTTLNTIPLADTGAFSKLIVDYVGSDKSLASFYSYTPSLDALSEIMLAYANQPVNRQLLVTVLKEQYAQVNSKNTALITDAIDKLLLENTFTVCTGHQLCIFTGPLYFIYKIVTTINLAKELKKKYPGHNFVPVYWMASEDHDFEEINHITVFEKQLSWGYSGAKGPVGKIPTASLDSVLAELTLLMGTAAEAQALLHLFTEAYLKQPTLAAATRYLVDALFSAYGLVILDAADKRLKQLFVPYIKDDVFNTTNYKIVTATLEELNKLGIKQQVNPRAINVFYMQDDLRERIEKVDEQYRVLNTDIVFTEQELLLAITNNPEHFSPNVILRPLYQQVVLPNLAYIGGPGELAYWLELKVMFNNHKSVFPALWLRNTALLVDAKSAKLIEKFDLKPGDLFKDTDLLINDYIKQHTGNIHLSLEEAQIKQTFRTIAEKAQAIDVTLKQTVEAELQRTFNAIKTLENKFLKAEKQKQEITVTQVKKLKNKLFPQGNLQERNDNFISFYLQYGDAFIPLLIEALNPLAFKFTVITITEG